MYYYRVRAYRDSDGLYSAYSHTAGALAGSYDRPAAPTDLTATAVSPSQIDLAWTDNAFAETAYHAERSPDGVTGWTEIAVLAADSTGFPESSLLCAERYFYRVRAFRATDETFSLYSAVADATTQLCPLAAPTSLSASAISSSQIDLSWDDNATDETAYLVERSLDGVTGWQQIATVQANSTAYSDTALSCSVEYYYRVQAYRGADQASSPYSNTASATTAHCTLAAPTVLSAVAVSTNEIDLAWMDNSADESAFHVERSLDGTTDWAEIAVIAENNTSYHDTGLACSTEYHYRVRAYRDSDGEYSQYSNVAVTTTEICDHMVYLPLILKILP